MYPLGKLASLQACASENGHRTGDDPTRTTIQATERLWLVYRDAFDDFGTLRYPSTTRDTWLPYVTTQRAHDLSDPCFLDANC